MTPEEKFNTCSYKPLEQTRVNVGCACQKKTKLVDKCTKLNILDLQPHHCADCVFYSQKTE